MRVAGGTASIDGETIRMESARVTTKFIRGDTLYVESFIWSLYSPGIDNLL